MRKLELAKKRDEAERARTRPKSAAPELASMKRAEEKAQKKGNLQITVISVIHESVINRGSAPRASPLIVGI